MAPHESFWWEANTWWKRMAKHVADKVATGQEWEEARNRLWDLSRKVSKINRPDLENKLDLVQDVLLKLQEPWLAERLLEIDAPAHYLARMISNRLRNDHEQERAARYANKCYARRIANHENLSPEQLASRKESTDQARIIVNHVVPANDRKLLVWYYWDGLSASEIAARLRISEVAGWQRLVRARVRVKQAFMT